MRKYFQKLKRYYNSSNTILKGNWLFASLFNKVKVQIYIYIKNKKRIEWGVRSDWSNWEGGAGEGLWSGTHGVESGGKNYKGRGGSPWEKHDSWITLSAKPKFKKLPKHHPSTPYSPHMGPTLLLLRWQFPRGTTIPLVCVAPPPHSKKIKRKKKERHFVV